MRAVVVGHVEWVRFLTVDREVASGAILRAAAERLEPAGGGGAAAAEFARLAGTSQLVTALGQDPLGQAIPEALGRAGVEVVGPTRAEAHRQAITLLEPSGERLIVVVGPAQSATGADVVPDFFDSADAVYFCKGAADLLRLARRAAVLVVTARVLPALREAGVVVDALVHSASDPHETYRDGDLVARPRLVASTDGARGGRWRTAEASGTWAASLPQGPTIDAYGAGDCFAAGLAWALALGHGPQAAVDFAATRGAAAWTRAGAGIV